MALNKILPALAVTVFIGGCSTGAYYSQAVSGHLKLMNARQDVATLLESPDLDATLREKLELSKEIRAFASAELGLPDNGSYKSFVKTGRDFVTWNVIAAGEFSVDAKTWCFPVAGCVSYKGYFDKEAAEKQAAELTADGYDTVVTGATAYSTLGWFDDPLLDTMLTGHELRLAGLIFHELAHQKLYLKGDSDFNEAYATFVEQQGVRTWLTASDRQYQLQAYGEFLQRREQFAELLLNAREKLQALYDSEISDDEKRQGKQAVFAEMRADYQIMKDQWQGYAGYDRWFEQEINNARLVAAATYRRLVPAFAALFNEQGGEFPAFYRRAAELSTMNKTERETVLAGLVGSEMPAASVSAR
ncbi:MAG: aminopeptidase [Gammaproteobacteria bacterium]|nr:aminopeptidase [Gammaproteobacteria bacterium]